LNFKCYALLSKERSFVLLTVSDSFNRIDPFLSTDVCLDFISGKINIYGGNYTYLWGEIGEALALSILNSVSVLSPSRSKSLSLLYILDDGSSLISSILFLLRGNIFSNDESIYYTYSLLLYMYPYLSIYLYILSDSSNMFYFKRFDSLVM
jgi:hypothetical protein